MRKKFLFIIVTTLLAGACKKDTKEITASPSLQSTTGQSDQLIISNGCYGNTWTGDDSIPATEYDRTLVYNNKAYVFQSTDWNHISIFDGTTWTTILSVSPLGEQHPDFCFTIGNKGYLGFSENITNGFWEYDFGTNTWNSRAGFPGPPRFGSATFTIGNKGYLVAGAHYMNGTPINYDDTWEYNQVNNVWTQKAHFPFLVLGRCRASGFSIGNLGYIVNGVYVAAGQGNNPDPQYLMNSLMQYDPVANAWTFKAHFPGDGRYETRVFVISGLAYVGVGLVNGNSHIRDSYKYFPSSDTWQAIPDFPDVTSWSCSISFALNTRGYVAYNYHNNPKRERLVKYTPLICGIGNPGPQ